MALLTSYQAYRSAAPSSKDRAIRSRAPSPSAIGFRVPRGLPAPPGLPVFVPGGGRGRNRQHVGNQPLEYTNEGIEIIDLTSHDRERPVLAGRGLTRAKADGHSTVAKPSGPAWTGTRAAKAGTAGDGGYSGYIDDSEDDLPSLDALMARSKRNRATAKAGDKLSTTAGRPGGSVGCQEGGPNGDRAVTAHAVAPGGSPDIPIVLDDDDDDDDDSNEDGDDEDNGDDDNGEDDTDRVLTAPPSPPGEVRIQHHGLPTGDARPGSASTAPAQAREWIEEGGVASNSSRAPAHNQAFSPRPEACKDSTEPEVGRSSPPSDSVIPSNTEDGLATQFPPPSLTEEASDCIYQDGDNGCQEPGHGAVDAPPGDAGRHYRSSASQSPEHSQSLDATKMVRSTASPTSETATGGPDYVRRLPKEQQRQYAPLRPDARLRHVIEADRHGQEEAMPHHLHQEDKKRRRLSLSPSPSPTAVEDRPRKRFRSSKSASQPPNIDRNVRIAQAPQEQEGNIPIICDGREVKPGDYVIVACETKGSNDDSRDDLPDIARVDKIRPDGRLNITWTYHPSHPSVPRGSEHGRFELLISDHKDTIRPTALTGLVEVEEYCENCLETEHWCWVMQFQTLRRRIRPLRKPRRLEEAS